jgi:hypothetical protein
MFAGIRITGARWLRGVRHMARPQAKPARGKRQMHCGYVTVDTACIAFTRWPLAAYILRVPSPAGDNIHHAPCTLFCGPVLTRLSSLPRPRGHLQPPLSLEH